MIFRPFLLHVNEANAYVVACEESGEALLVDAGDYDRDIEDFLDEKRLRLAAVFITHDHYDHTGGLPAIIARHDTVVLSGSGIGAKAKRVKQDSVVRIGKLTGRVLATPGHTRDGVSLTFPGIVFTGDALFAGSIGGVTSPQDGKCEVDHIRANIFTLPDDYEIHPGHGPSSTIEIERRYNPFFV